MSLQVWLPLNGDLHNQGLNPIISTSTAYTIENAGKIGKCIKCTNANFNTGITAANWDFTTTSISFGGWVKINKTELEARTTSTTYDSTNNSAGGTLMGYDAYGGLGLRWKTNNIYSTGSLSAVTLYVHIRNTSSGSVSTSAYTLSFDTWVHVLVVFNREKQTLGLYINGVLFNEKACSTATYATSGNITQNTFLFNQASWDGGNGRSLNVPWQINDFRLYNHALSPKEVEEIAKGLVLHYKLDWQSSLVPENAYNFNAESGVTKTQESDGSTKIDCSGKTSSRWGIYYDIQNALPNTTYTFSVDCKVADSAKPLQLSVGCNPVPSGTSKFGSNRQSMTATSAFTRYSVTVTTNSDTTWIRLYFGMSCNSTTTNQYAYVKNPRVVLGSGDSLLGATIFDSSGYSHNGTIVGSLTAAAGSPRYDVATQFPGSTYISESNEITTTDSTISLWINPSLSAAAHILDARNSSESGKQPIYAYTNGSIQTGGSANYVTSNTGLLVANTWTHLVLVQSGNSLLIYKNGTLFQTLSCTNSPLIKPTLGARLNAANKYTGKLSDFRIYATALTATQIKELYNTSMSIDSNGNVYARELNEL